MTVEASDRGRPQHEVLLHRIERSASTHRRKFRPLKSHPERVRIEVDGKPYLIFIPTSKSELTPGRVAQRVAKWPRIGRRDVEGYVILSTNADLSATLIRDDGESLPENVAVVGGWQTQDQVVASRVDRGVAVILEAAGIRPAVITRLRKRKRQTADHVTAVSAAGPVAADQAELSWRRSPSRGLQLDAYRLGRRLGRGYSAEVWRARMVRRVPGVELQVGDDVAMKIYLPSLMQGFQTLRVQREFALAADVNHPNFAKVFDLVLSPSRPFHSFMVMELIEGPSLKQLIDQRGPLPRQAVISIGHQLFGALAELHSHGAVHRDVKASNVMIVDPKANPWTIKLVDLGIVALFADERLTQGSVFLGSKHSAPLEQLSGEAPDERTDVYGAGSVLYHCLTGKPMYDGLGPEGAIVRRMLSRPEELAVAAAGEPSMARLYEVVNQCIRVDPRERPATATQCIRLLEALA